MPCEPPYLNSSLVACGLPEEWEQAIHRTMSDSDYARTAHFVKNCSTRNDFYPPFHLLFKAFQAVLPTAIKVVILGQDPYHDAGQADGLAFSVPQGTKPLPPSLRNILKELEADLGQPPIASGDLSNWASQGVLLLNTVLSVQHNQPGSHRQLGWEAFTDAAITAASQESESAVFILWGNWARRKAALIDLDKHLVWQSAHPSPLAAYRGFFGSKPFSQANAWLAKYGKGEIEW